MPIEFIDFRNDRAGYGDFIDIPVPSESNIHVAYILSTHKDTTPVLSGWALIGSEAISNAFMEVYLRVGDLSSNMASFYVNGPGPNDADLGAVFLASFKGSLLSYVIEKDYLTLNHPELPAPANLPPHPDQIDGYTVVRVTSIDQYRPITAPSNWGWVPPPENHKSFNIVRMDNSGWYGTMTGQTQTFYKERDSLEPFPSVAIQVQGTTDPSEYSSVASLILLSASDPGVSIETPQGVGKLTTVLSGQEVQPAGLEIIQP